MGMMMKTGGIGSQPSVQMMMMLLLMSSAPAPVRACDWAQTVCGAQAPGNILLGIMLPCHRRVTAMADRVSPGTFHCSDFDLSAFVRSMAVIYEIEAVNAAGFLPGLRLGYVLCDTCSHTSKALLNIEYMLSLNESDHSQCDNSDFRPAVKVVLGALYSEVTIALAKLLNVYMLPLLSSTSTSSELSDKLRYPSFLRTVPSDEHQTRAIAGIMKYYGWNWVGVVYEDDEYGKAAFRSFQLDAEGNGICLSYQETVHPYLDPSQSQARLSQVAQVIRSSGALVVLLILKPELVELLFREMLKTNTSRVWVSSDSWSQSVSVAQMEGINDVGDILGFTFTSFKSKSFDDYLRNLTVTPGGYNYFIQEYQTLRSTCAVECASDTPPTKCINVFKSACDKHQFMTMTEDYLPKATDTGKPFLQRVAVWAVAHSIRRLLNCNSSSCSGDINFPPWKLLRELKNITFEFENQTYYFDQNGDFADGYDLIMWEKHGSGRIFQKLGKYHILNDRIELHDREVIWLSTNNISTPQSRCSDICRPGQVKKIINVSCCYACTECEEGSYTEDWDMPECKPCPNGTWSLRGWTSCKPRSPVFLRWSDPHPITMMAAAGVGILLLLLVLVVFMVHRNSPAMKRAEVRLSSVMMAGLAVSLASVVLFMGRPSVHVCRARQVAFAMGFSLCVSCILVKAYRTFLVFLPFGQLLHRRLHKLYKPPLIIVTLTSLQGLICLLWLILDPPDVDDTPPSLQSMRNVLKCKEGNTYIGFGVMLGYIALLALAGFLLAFKGRKVPQEFSETGYIIFSMLMYLFVWVCFIPVYITSAEDGTRVQASAILVSSYGIIFCHFLPKCYEALWSSGAKHAESMFGRCQAKPDKEDKHIHVFIQSSDIIVKPTSSLSSSVWTSETQSTGRTDESESTNDMVCLPPRPAQTGTMVTRRQRSSSL